MRKIVLLLNPSRTYTRGLLGGIAKYARLQGLWTFYRPLAYREPKARRGLLHVLKSLKPDGIFMREPEEMDRIIALGVPTVSFSYSREIIPGVANVTANHRAVGEVAAQHLLDRGFHRFAYCGFDDWWWSRRRRDGFCQTVGRAGHPTDIYQLPSKSRRSWAKELPLVADWLQTLEKPIGLLACNDDRGELVVEACKLAGLSVPDQVAIMGVDNDPLICDLCSPPLSSVALSLEKAGYESAALLDRMMTRKKGKLSHIRIEPTHIVARQSTDILAVEDAEVAKAIRFVRQHAKTKINVDEVVKQVSLSRRVLEKRFRHILGKSIYEEIRHVRVELLVRMLTETGMSISDIAQALDFDDVTHLSRYFRKEKGLSPLQYRKQKT